MLRGGGESGTGSGGWRIAETSLRCRSCGRVFLPDERFVSKLVLEGDAVPRLVREDRCRTCWEARPRAQGPEIFWWTKRRPDGRRGPVVDLEALAKLFGELLEDPRPEVEALRYVVALMLLRKRRLKRARTAQAARGDLVFRDPRDPEGGRILRLAAPDFDEATLSGLKEQLAAVLGT